MFNIAGWYFNILPITHYKNNLLFKFRNLGAIGEMRKGEWLAE